jgi:hypothetical protein
MSTPREKIAALLAQAALGQRGLLAPTNSAAAYATEPPPPTTPNYVSEQRDVMKIIEDNKNKGFVQRLINPDQYPTLDLGGGNYATHKMAWNEEDGKYNVYPTVLFDGKKLVDYSGDPQNAYRLAKQTGNVIPFDTPQAADWFSQRYKLALGMNPKFEPDLTSTGQWYAGRYGQSPTGGK